MRFPRKAQIFRGPLDPAPVAAVLFLMMLFVLLGSLVYTPGVLIELKNGASPHRILTITRDNQVLFNGKTYEAADLNQLRADVKKYSDGDELNLEVNPGAPEKLAEQVRSIFQIDLPSSTNFVSTDNPQVVVAVNFRGQVFFENQIIGDDVLKERLKRRLEATARESKELTLVLWADKAAENQVITRLCALARDVGVKDVLLAVRPGVFTKSSPPGKP